MVCLYTLFIQVISVAKVFYGFRFDPQLYSDFKKVTGAHGCTVTGTFERFMQGCVEADALVFVERKVLDFEVEARVLADWLIKGKLFYRNQDGEEINIQGRLLWLLPKVHDNSLKKDIEDALKKSVLPQK